MTACKLNCSLRLKAFRQWHKYGRSGLCDCLWRVKWSFLFNAALQISQTNRRSMFWCPIICWSRISLEISKINLSKGLHSISIRINYFSGYATWHSGQTKSIDPSNANFNRISPAFGLGFFSLGVFFFFFFFGTVVTVGCADCTLWITACVCWIGWIIFAIDEVDGIKFKLCDGWPWK